MLHFSKSDEETNFKQTNKNYSTIIDLFKTPKTDKNDKTHNKITKTLSTIKEKRNVKIKSNSKY